MEDPDKDVRIAFSGNIKYILESLNSEDGFIKEVRNLKLKHTGFYKPRHRTILTIYFAFLAFCVKNEGSIYTCPDIKE